MRIALMYAAIPLSKVCLPAALQPYLLQIGYTFAAPAAFAAVAAQYY